MEQITIFKICDLHMNNRQMIACQPNRESVLDHGSSALQKQVNRILLAADGCEITTDLVLTACQSQLLMLLSQGEAWMSFGSNTVPVEETANSPFRVEVPIGDSNTIGEDYNLELADEIILLEGGHTQDATEMKSFNLSDLHVKNPGFDAPIGEFPVALTSPSTSTSTVQKAAVTARAADECEPSKTDENRSPNVPTKRPVEQISIVKPKRKLTTDMKFHSFQIDWTKVSDRLLNKFKDHQEFVDKNPDKPVPREVRITNDDINDLIPVVVEQLRAIDTDISADVMKSVALQITGKFPCLDFPDDDGFKDGKGFVMIKSKLINRNSYCKRFKEGKVVSSSRSDRSKQLNAKSGTLKEYWENTAAECPKAAHSILLRDEPDLLTDSVLEETQPFVRVLLNSQDTHKMLSKWPVLRRANLLKFHFEKATGRNLNDLSKYWNAKKTKMIDYSRTVKKTVPLGGEATTLQICTFLAFLVGEEINKLIINKEMGTSIDDIFTNEASPVIVGIGESSHIFN
ncbi:uncharacterized protein LOC120414991 [Culex pipiens pallens]|uniref:uncharacterized protein LOC120414991 n=1 Tax=Culex pipiens pallens TaxID=42434 RepID=UPI001953A5A8|nr:uncharacterized protein LOC120414991 [Culex pipiens pallens]